MALNVLPGALVTRDVTVFANASQTEPLDISEATVELAIYDAPNGTVVTDLDTSIAILDDSVGALYFTVESPADYGIHVYYFAVKLTEADSTSTIVDSGKLITGVV